MSEYVKWMFSIAASFSKKIYNLESKQRHIFCAQFNFQTLKLRREWFQNYNKKNTTHLAFIMKALTIAFIETTQATWINKETGLNLSKKQTLT